MPREPPYDATDDQLQFITMQQQYEHYTFKQKAANMKFKAAKSGVPMSFDPYICRLVSVTFEEAKKPSEDDPPLSFTPKDQYRFEFVVADGEYEGSAVMGWANDVALTPKAKLRQWLGMLDGDSLLPDECERDPEDYVGRIFRVWVAENEKRTATRVDRFTPYEPGEPNAVGSDEAAEVTEEAPF